MADTPTKDERPGSPFDDDTLPASDSPADPAASRPSTPQERYRLGAELGRGGMGRVVEAFDLQLGRSVALKEVLPKVASGTSRRFEREIQLTARLEHPSIVPIYDAGFTADGRPFYVMRRVSGRPFDELIGRARGLDERLTLVPPLLAAIDAVAHAHRRGVIHRDIKPQNILVGDLGETIVIDWGLAKVLGEEDAPADEDSISPADSLKTQVGSVFGTPGFMSPEQARGEELGPRADVFALGATLYQLLAGTPPHQGTSATEVIDKTARHDVRPLAQVAPGAPSELVAIVEKALAFDAAKRYANAGALGEDVRRFLAGQLVAAHRYTNLQHVARFARRHRAPLGVAALALVAVAALAWIFVARIITERDAADVARGAAVERRREAEAARDALAERNDALLLTQARALLDHSPTEAVATLKSLAKTSPRQAEARAIAQAAVTRGVAWALESTPAMTLVAELEPGGRRMLQVSIDGVLRIWDLELRRSLLARTYVRGTRALWVAGGRALVIPPQASPQLLDPAKNTSEPLAIDPITTARTTAAGDRVLLTTAARGAKLLDVERRAVTDVDTEGDLDDVVIAPDGSWIALLDRKRDVRVLDAAGKELVRRAGAHPRAVVSPSGALALLTDDGKVVACRPASAPAWIEVPLELPKTHRVLDLVYRGEELDMWASTGALLAWNGKRVFQRLQVDKITSGMYVAGGDTLILPGVDGKLHFLNDIVRGTLRLPSVVPHPRLAAHRGSRRLMVAGDGVILGLDLASVVPRAVPQPMGLVAWFVDDHTLLGSLNIDWQWIDLETGAARPITYLPHGVPLLGQIDAPTGRVLVREGMGPAQRLILLQKGATESRVVAEGRAVWGRLIAGDTIVFGVGDGRVLAQVGTAEPREVAKLDGAAQSAIGLGHRRFAAHSSGGELVRSDLATDELTRAHVGGRPEAFVETDGAGRVLIADERRLLLWDGAVSELARFEKPIGSIDPYEGGVVVHLSDFEAQALELSPAAGASASVPVRLLPPSKRSAAVSADGKLLAGLGPSQEVTIVELPARARWTLPVLFEASAMLPVLTLSPSSRRLVQNTDRHLVIWTLPQAGADLGAWLDELTNATIDGGVLAWPWQRPQAP
ncbi:MAG TPA: serine/threonine-protein kinase [Kofleriaceae bacterium]|nr:serine/threonine-protein kinase [Kofleriaceae bacterium]